MTTVSALSNTFISPSFPASYSYQSKFSSLGFTNSRSQPLRVPTQLRKTTCTTRFTTFSSLDAANDPKENTQGTLRFQHHWTSIRFVTFCRTVSAVAIKNVTINDNFFPGHFPERPIMPGVLMVEAMAQVGGLVLLQPEVGGSPENFFFAGIDKVPFRKPVIAGDTLVMRMTLIKLQKQFRIAKMEGKAYVGGEVVCEGEFLMATGSE